MEYSVNGSKITAIIGESAKMDVQKAVHYIESGKAELSPLVAEAKGYKEDAESAAERAEQAASSIPTVNDGVLTIQKNGTLVGTFTANQEGDSTVNLIIPTTPADIGALPDSTTINDLTTTAQLAALNSGANSTNIAQIATNTGDISTINGKIPSAATTTNQLADKDFVDSSIATNTANFIGTFNSVAELEAYSGTLTNNDYAFVVVTDSFGNTAYDRYKYTTATTPAGWQFEYELNNSSFTAQQWAAINSGANETNIGQITTNQNAIGTLSSLNTTVKTDLVSAVNEVEGVANTALQPNDNISSLTNDSGYITGITSSDVTTALGFTPANTSLSNLSSDGQMVVDTQNGTISNCILEIPQNIKVELSNNVLTLKAGSILVRGGNTYVTTTTTIDRSYTIPSTQAQGRYFSFAERNTGALQGLNNIVKITSGTTAQRPEWSLSIANSIYFDVDTKTFYYATSTQWIEWVVAYPLCVIDVDSNGVASFAKDSNGNDIIFNGAGYIGHHVFVYPDVKALLPDGLNSDGTCKSINYTASTLQIIELVSNALFVAVSTTTLSQDIQKRYIISETEPENPANNAIWYNPVTNLMQRPSSGSWKKVNKAYLIKCRCQGTSVTDFEIFQPVRVATTEMLENMQTTTNLVTSVSSASTDSQYPSAKLLYDTVGNIETLLHNINSGS